MTPEQELNHYKALCEELRADKERLDYLHANPKIILRSGKQHIRPLIDAARAALKKAEKL